MIRNRIVAALLVSVPLTACEMTAPEAVEPGQQKTEELALGEVQSALAALPSAQVVGTHGNGIPFMIKGRLGSADGAVLGIAQKDAAAGVSKALPAIAAVFRLNASDLSVKRVSRDELGNTSIRYSQMKNGLPVVGGELVIHMDKNNVIFAANGSARDGESVLSVARTTPEIAVASALNSTVGYRIAPEGEPRLVYIRSNQTDKLTLAYEVVVTGEGRELPIRDHVFVSAADGKTVVERATDIHTALNRAVYSGNNTTSLPGTLRRGEGAVATGDAHIDMNYDHLKTTYDCYKVNFNRDSYNNLGAQLKSTVHHSTNYVNAYWNGSQMVYGDGDNSQSGMLGKDLDVTVHELTHAVTSSESNLTYSNESGALNEGMSDIFAAYCESWVSGTWSTSADIWMIGEDIWTPATAGDALRYMANPTQDGSSKDYYPTRYTGTSDNGGVHWNSGIANLAFKLLSTGGTHPRGVNTVSVPAIGVQKAGAIFYKANVDLMTASTTFAQAKTYTESAAGTLYGAGSAEQAAVTKAWEAVGVGLPPPPPTALTNGVAKTGLSGASGSQTHYYLDVPAGMAVTFTMSGGTGDADMYVKFGSQPSTSSYECRPYKAGNAETCTMAAKTTAGRYYVMLNGYSSYASVSLKGQY